MIPDAEARIGPMQSAEHDPRVTRTGADARNCDGRAAPALEHLPRRHELCGAASAAARRDRSNGGGRIGRLEEFPGFAVRCAVRPGLTGVAQIYAPRDVVRRHKFRYDRFYIRRQSFWLDVRLILLSFWITFPAMGGRGRKF